MWKRPCTLIIELGVSESAILGREAVDVEIEREETLPTAELEKNRFAPKSATAIETILATLGPR